MRTFPCRLGLTLGTFAGLVHLIWALFVAIGLAEPLMVGIMQMHFVKADREVMSFFLGDAIVLVFVAFVVGNCVGWILGKIWERVNNMK